MRNSKNGSDKKPGLSEAGFTMLELMVSMAILTILMGLGMFALFSYWRAQALTGAADQVLTDLRDAQVRAQAEVRTYRLVFDLDANTYRSQRLESTAPPCALAGQPCWVDVETRTFEQTIDITVADFESIAGCFVATPPLLEVQPNEIYFCPRGISSRGNVIVRSTRLNQDREITVTGITSKAELR